MKGVHSNAGYRYSWRCHGLMQSLDGSQNLAPSENGLDNMLKEIQ
jgi:hypothetical protein